MRMLLVQLRIAPQKPQNPIQLQIFEANYDNK